MKIQKTVILITVHAAIRMTERIVTKEHFREVGRTAFSIKHQDSSNALDRVKDKDLEGEIMEVICEYIDKTLIVTVLTKEELL